jgi:ADP-ribosyl-[dinitrogen reductase] hydrolase
MTHADPRATWGAVALNQGIAHLLEGGTLAGLVGAATDDIDEGRVVDAIAGAPGAARDDIASGGYVLDTLRASFWAVAGTTSAEEAIICAVGLGWDTDTTAAVTGAIAGAHYGVSALPERWLSVLHDRERIRTLAHRITDWGP